MLRNFEEKSFKACDRTFAAPCSFKNLILITDAYQSIFNINGKETDQRLTLIDTD